MERKATGRGRRITAAAVLIAALLAGGAAPVAAVPPGTGIVILGEVHDNPAAHLGQAEALRALAPRAVVFEMLTAEEGAAVQADRAALPAIWAESGWPDLAIYRPVFDALGQAVIVGAAVPRDATRGVYESGAGAAFGPEADRYGLAAPLAAADQAAREQEQFDAHCGALPRTALPGMVEVQRYRDAVMARAALQALAAHGAPVAIVTGNGHARIDTGIPAVLARAAPDVATHAIGFTEHAEDGPFDETRPVPAVTRGDPCADLRG